MHHQNKAHEVCHERERAHAVKRSRPTLLERATRIMITCASARCSYNICKPNGCTVRVIRAETMLKVKGTNGELALAEKERGK